MTPGLHVQAAASKHSLSTMTETCDTPPLCPVCWGSGALKSRLAVEPATSPSALFAPAALDRRRGGSLPRRAALSRHPARGGTCTRRSAKPEPAAGLPPTWLPAAETPARPQNRPLPRRKQRHLRPAEPISNGRGIEKFPIGNSYPHRRKKKNLILSATFRFSPLTLS